MHTLFCNDGCRESFLEDRQAGVIYPAGLIRQDEVPAGALSTPQSGGMALVGWTTFCAVQHSCAYCRTDLPCCEVHQTPTLRLEDVVTLSGGKPYASHARHPGRPAVLACALAGIR